MTNGAAIESYPVIWSCRNHPDWWHETGCPHMPWTPGQLLGAIETLKRSNEYHVSTFNCIPKEIGRGAAMRADRGEPKGVEPREGNPSSSALASEGRVEELGASVGSPKREPVTANTEGQPRADEASRSTGCWDALDRK